MKQLENKYIEWIGQIPVNWKIGKIGQLYNERKQKVSDKDYEPLSVTKQGILPQLDNVAKSEAHDDRKLVMTGDFVINSRSDRRGACGIADRNGSVSLINTTLIPQTTMNPKYYNWLFHTTMFSDEFYKWGHGIVDDLWTTSWQEMKSIMIPIPPLSIQKKIADFLDKKCEEIDIVLNKTRNSIEDYAKLKKAIINKAVTMGIKRTRKMKSTGSNWINQIPEDWDIRRLRFMTDSFDKGNGISKEEVFTDGDTPCVRYGEIYSKYEQSFCICESKTNIDILKGKKYFSKGDILCAGTGELVEEIGKSVVYMGEEQCLAGGDIIIIKHHQNPIFLNYAINSDYAQAQKSFGKTKLKVVHISATELKNIILYLPPIQEQNEIAEYLDKECLQIDKLISLKEDFMNELETYKKSLIYEYVTGKKEVQ